MAGSQQPIASQRAGARYRSRQFSLHNLLVTMGILCTLLAVLHGVRDLNDGVRGILLAVIAVAFLSCVTAYPHIPHKWLLSIQATNALGIVLGWSFVRLRDPSGWPLAFSAAIGFIAAWFLVGRRAEPGAPSEPGQRGESDLETK